MGQFFTDPEREDDGGYPAQPGPGAPGAPGAGAPGPGAPTGGSVDPVGNIPGTYDTEGGGNGGNGHGNGGGQQGYNPGNGPVFNIPRAPTFTAPTFNRPSMQDALNEPGYQFRAEAGNQALERSAAARGVLRTGGTLRDLVEYGQNFASQEYGQVFNRALSSYDRQYQGARDEFAPTMARYQAQLSSEQQRAMALYNRQWEAYTFGHQNKGGGGGGGGGGQPDMEAPPDPNKYVPSGSVPDMPDYNPGKHIPSGNAEVQAASFYPGGSGNGYRDPNEDQYY